MRETALPPLVVLDTPVHEAAKIVISGVPGVHIRADGTLDLCEVALAGEMRRLAERDVATLIAFVEDVELGPIAYGDIEEAADAHGIGVRRLPVVDFGVPGPAQERPWAGIRQEAARHLAAGRSIAMHCLAGIGRSSMMAGNLLVHLGEAPHRVVDRLRAAQPEALETAAQVAYVRRALTSAEHTHWHPGG